MNLHKKNLNTFNNKKSFSAANPVATTFLTLSIIILITMVCVSFSTVSENEETDNVELDPTIQVMEIECTEEINELDNIDSFKEYNETVERPTCPSNAEDLTVVSQVLKFVLSNDLNPKNYFWPGLGSVDLLELKAKLQKDDQESEFSNDFSQYHKAENYL